MASKSLLSFFIIFSSFLHVGLSQTSAADLLKTLTQAAHEGSVQCMQKLLPCQHYLKNSSDPPLTCCSPLKEMMANDTECLCKFLNDPEFLQSVNVTQDDALNLPKACGSDADISICHKEASAPTSSGSATALLASLSNGSTGSTAVDREDANAESSSTKITATIPAFATLLITLIRLSA